MLDSFIRQKSRLSKALGFQSISHMLDLPGAVEHPDAFLDVFASNLEEPIVSDSAYLLSDPEGKLWFSLEEGLHALEIMASDVFDLSLRRESITSDEWVDQSLLSKLSLWDSCGRRLGTLYLDVFHRPNKPLLSALLNIETGFQNQEQVSVMVSNFTHVLSFRDFQTLLHEFGHFLHSACSKSKYQILAAGRGPLNLLEVPAALLERFSHCPEYISRVKGASMLRLETHKRREDQHSHSLRRRIFLSLFDRCICSEEISEYDEPCHQALFRIASTYSELKDAMDLPYLHSLIQSGHLVSYLGSYYSYLFSEVFAEKLFQKHFSSAPLNTDGGKKIRENLLSPGIRVHPQKLLKSIDSSFYEDLAKCIQEYLSIRNNQLIPTD